MAYTKSNEEPSDTKMAMLDRTIAHMVRSIGKNAHTDQEFQAHLSKPEQQRKLSMFRLLVCLMGATKLCIKGVPLFHPDLGYALRVFDHLDNDVIVGEYGLPYRQPRKTLKREEDLRTICVMQAVANVFFYKQVSNSVNTVVNFLALKCVLCVRRQRSCLRRATSGRTESRSPSAGPCCTT